MNNETERQPIYEYQEEVEHLESYRNGGYHPTDIGNSYLDGRYRIVHKLGFGTYSTVWLARDNQMHRYVALKIIASDASKTSTESKILRHLDRSVTKARSSLFTALLDDFYIDGPNGRHLCLVTEPTRCNVGESKMYRPFVFPLDVARAVAAQMILGVKSIHLVGVVHGDLHPRNILLSMPTTDSISDAQIYQILDEPKRIEIKRVDGAPLGPEAPSHAVWPAFTFISSTQVTDPRIRISDFGEAWFGAHLGAKQSLNTPPPYLPPEALFAKDQLGFPAEIWTLACSLYEILGERSFCEGLCHDTDDVIEQLVRYLGPLPAPWWKAWEARATYFEEDELWKGISGEKRPLSVRIQDMRRECGSGFSDDEADCLEQMLGSMLKFEPSKRATIEQVAHSDWMVRCGLPALQHFGIVV
ncbi:MAG: hypothetical protein Q9220_007662 [cf. Caloplaca sp. 1 TL-2023]